MSNKKISKESVVQTINVETGEVVEQINTKTYSVDREPNYIKMYIDDITRLNDLPKGLSPILLELVRTMGYNNIIPAYKPIKMMVCRRLDISLNYLDKSIQKLHKKGILIRIHRGIYMADPDLFARGKWEDIKSLRLIVDYDKDGSKKLKSDLSEQMQLRLNL